MHPAHATHDPPFRTAWLQRHLWAQAPLSSSHQLLVYLGPGVTNLLDQREERCSGEGVRVCIASMRPCLHAHPHPSHRPTHVHGLTAASSLGAGPPAPPSHQPVYAHGMHGWSHPGRAGPSSCQPRVIHSHATSNHLHRHPPPLSSPSPAPWIVSTCFSSVSCLFMPSVVAARAPPPALSVGTCPLRSFSATLPSLPFLPPPCGSNNAWALVQEAGALVLGGKWSNLTKWNSQPEDLGLGWEEVKTPRPTKWLSLANVPRRDHRGGSPGP